ncbi:MAG TPA: glycoside hydrolase family 57 protein [Anaeromyxobacteraceae bacterium]|nr:glycoside hydrolase family 57 protein [Anaeromyxobacteraceae bacterium]
MTPVRLAFLWHMHQPLYRDPETGEHLLPWVRLHAARAYNDMASVLERHPGVRCTVNFTPVLLEQLEEQAGGAADRFADLSLRRAGDLSEEERQLLLAAFFMVDWDQQIRPLPRFWELLEKRGRDLRSVDLPRAARAFSQAELTDLQALFNLAWMGFAARDEEPGVRALREKGRDYSPEDVAFLLEAQRRIVRQIVPRWRRLAERGQVELSTTPYHHPILPLVCDSDAAARALPGLPLPPRFAWPEDARWHVRAALQSHQRHFGRPAAGMWPAEGSVSPEALEVLAGEGVGWAASDEGVLLRSLGQGASRAASLYRPWRAAAGAGREVAMLFRDRGLADLIGFTYARTPAPEAVADFMARLRQAGEAWRQEGGQGPATVGVFLDGENPWEHFPDSAREFLDGLHRSLAEEPGLETVTVAEAVSGAGGPALPAIHSGSWIESSFRIWIGHREDRLAWTALGRARQALAEQARAGAVSPEDLERARSHLHVAEGSDWYWWYGEDFSTELAAEFDALFRGHVLKACQLLKVVPPFEALQPIKRAGAAVGLEQKPLREPTELIHPVVDGGDPTFFEWKGAGRYRPGQHRGTMFGGAQAFGELHYGFDLESLYLRLDPAESAERAAEAADHVRVVLLAAHRESRVDFELRADGQFRRGRAEGAEIGHAACRQLWEAGLPFADLGLREGNEVALAVVVLRGEVEVERLPRSGFLTFTVPGPDFERIHWRV